MTFSRGTLQFRKTISFVCEPFSPILCSFTPSTAYVMIAGRKAKALLFPWLRWSALYLALFAVKDITREWILAGSVSFPAVWTWR